MRDWLKAVAGGVPLSVDPLEGLSEGDYARLCHRADGREEPPERTAAALLEAYVQMGGGTVEPETPEGILAWALLNDL